MAVDATNQTVVDTTSRYSAEQQQRLAQRQTQQAANPQPENKTNNGDVKVTLSADNRNERRPEANDTEKRVQEQQNIQAQRAVQTYQEINRVQADEKANPNVRRQDQIRNVTG